MGTLSDKTKQTPTALDVPDEASPDGTKKKTVLLSRRSVLGILGFQAAAGAALATTGFAAPKNFDPKCTNRGIKPEQLPDARAWLVTDPTTCVGCRNCEIICSLAHDGECRPSLARIHIRYDPTKTLSSLAELPDICKQCNMADCYLACQYDALVIDPKTGARIIDPEKCQNCGECFAACPWNMIVQNEDAERYTKCDLCGGDPQCVEFCPASAIKFIQLS